MEISNFFYVWSAFPWWLLMFNTFLCVCWPSLYILEKCLYSGLLSIFYFNCLFLLLLYIWVFNTSLPNTQFANIFPCCRIPFCFCWFFFFFCAVFHLITSCNWLIFYIFYYLCFWCHNWKKYCQDKSQNASSRSFLLGVYDISSHFMVFNLFWVQFFEWYKIRIWFSSLHMIGLFLPIPFFSLDYSSLSYLILGWLYIQWLISASLFSFTVLCLFFLPVPYCFIYYSFVV